VLVQNPKFTVKIAGGLLARNRPSLQQLVFFFLKRWDGLGAAGGVLRALLQPGAVQPPDAVSVPTVVFS
jgi:hypothetical protein